MPADVIGIHVDQYAKGNTQKHGAQTLTEHLEHWGPLPATWTSTARDPNGPIRRYFVRVLAQRYATRMVGASTGDVEISQRHHRYAVVAPSVHQDAGALYGWYAPDGSASDTPPRPTELPDLPQAWVDGLLEGAASASARPSDRASGEALLEQLSEDWRPECADVTSARMQAVEAMDKAEAAAATTS